MQRDRTKSHVHEWADLVDEDVPEALRDEDDEDRDSVRT
jgi:hypothetical protein